MWREIITSLDADAQFYDPATEEDIRSIESSLGVSVPQSLHELLLETNGVILESSQLALIWSAKTIETTNLHYRIDPVFVKNYMAFGSLLLFADTGDGGKFAFSIVNNNSSVRNEVFAWNHEDDSRCWVAPSLERYIEWWITGKIGV